MDPRIISVRDISWRDADRLLRNSDDRHIRAAAAAEMASKQKTSFASSSAGTLYGAAIREIGVAAKAMLQPPALRKIADAS